MTETHKAAVEVAHMIEQAEHLEDWLKVGSLQDTGLTQSNCKALHKWAVSLCEALRTLKQPSSVEVTVDELAKRLVEDSRSPADSDGILDTVLFGYWKARLERIARMFPNGLRIIRAAATDGVGNGET